MAFERPEIFVRLCEEYSSTGNQKLAATRCGVSEFTFYRWLRESAAGKDGFELEFLGEQCRFHEAMKRADQILTYAVAGAVAKRSLLGSDSVVFYKGEPTPIMAHDLPLDDPRYIPPDVKDDELFLLYGVHDRRARDPITGAVEYFKEHTEAPVALQLAFLASKLPKIWGSHQNIEVSSRSTGVLVLKDKRTDAPRPAVAIAPPVAKPMMAEIAVEIADPLAEPEIADHVTAAPPLPRAMPPTKLTPEQEAIKARLLGSSRYDLANAARKPAAPVTVFPPSDDDAEKTAEPPAARPVVTVRPAPPQAGGRFESDDTRRENIGTGIVRPGGFKVR